MVSWRRLRPDGAQQLTSIAEPDRRPVKVIPEALNSPQIDAGGPDGTGIVGSGDQNGIGSMGSHDAPNERRANVDGHLGPIEGKIVRRSFGLFVECGEVRLGVAEVGSRADLARSGAQICIGPAL